MNDLSKIQQLIAILQERLNPEQLKRLQATLFQNIHTKSQNVTASASLIAGRVLNIGHRKLSTTYTVECVGPDGRVKWTDKFHNIVVTAGLNDSLTQHLKGSAYTAAWYVGLTSSSPTPAAGDTMSSHGGWTEVTDYSEGTREALTLGTVSGGSVDNSASKASFSINGTVTVGGAFVVNESTKSGTSGTLYGIGAFTEGNRDVVSGDTLNVTVTLTATAA